MHNYTCWYTCMVCLINVTVILLHLRATQVSDRGTYRQTDGRTDKGKPYMPLLFTSGAIYMLFLLCLSEPLFKKWKKSWLVVSLGGNLKYFAKKKSSSPQKTFNVKLDLISIKTGTQVCGFSFLPLFHSNSTLFTMVKHINVMSLSR